MSDSDIKYLDMALKTEYSLPISELKIENLSFSPEEIWINSGAIKLTTDPDQFLGYCTYLYDIERFIAKACYSQLEIESLYLYNCINMKNIHTIIYHPDDLNKYNKGT